MTERSAAQPAPSSPPAGASAGLPRRTVLHAAWAAPVVVAAVAAPSAAASPGSTTVTLTISNVYESDFTVFGSVTSPEGVGIETDYDLQVRDKTTLVWSSYSTGTTDADGNVYVSIPYSLGDANDLLRLQAGVAPDLTLSPTLAILVPGPSSVSLSLSLVAEGRFVIAATNVVTWLGMPIGCPVSYQAHSPVGDTWTQVATATTNAQSGTAAPAIDKAALAGYDVLRAVADLGGGSTATSGQQLIP
ncbi:hypothetical protein [Herbiconiux sp.]|uniref:hypothetical protein n=1 Tax=Herbiconiux sp. TaxID=1871186 RepID=UPI0025C3D6FD|nr:hypothetical protein [Herbiconiux sp.]